eukprot:8129803-Karenia_brevis.AAC.1
MIERRVANKIGGPALRGRRANLGALTRILKSNAKNALTSKQKLTLRCAAANAIWTRQRQAEA